MIPESTCGRMEVVFLGTILRSLRCATGTDDAPSAVPLPARASASHGEGADGRSRGALPGRAAGCKGALEGRSYLRESLARWDLRRARPGHSSLRDPECHLGARKVVRPFGLVLGRALDPDVPAVTLDDLLGDRQDETPARRALIA